MEKKKNPVWSFFASVKLALFTLFVLAVASIIGTIVPQKEVPEKYIELYGPNIANFFQILDIPDMYASWWFVSMLILFSLNLIVCTIERFPHIWKVVVQDNMATEASRLKKMAMRHTFTTSATMEQTEAAVQEVMGTCGWQAQKGAKGEGTLFFSQKGAWTRLAVIIVHVSILVIFVGSLIGTFFGYKASVMIPEGASTAQVYQSNFDHTPIPLDFQVRCDDFNLTYYDTGAPKEFRSKLVVLKDGKEVYKKSIVVNDPMQYGGLTFYQSSYQAMDGQFSAHMKNTGSGAEQRFMLMPRRELKWPGENISFGITSISGPDFMRRFRYKIWFSDGKGAPSEFWINEGATARVERPEEAVYELTVSPRFATGLQVVKDPGVWTVYIGCGLMILGLIVIFFMSHRRVWVLVSKGDKDVEILLSGISNKNKIGFEKDMSDLVEELEEHKALGLSE